MDVNILDKVSKDVRTAVVCTKTKPDSVSAHGKQNSYIHMYEDEAGLGQVSTGHIKVK
jgi:hypothetical protein